MEIIIIIAVVLVALAGFYLSRKPKDEPGSASAPYKVEAPVVTDQVTDAVTQEAAPAKKTRAKKAPVAKKTAVKKTAVIKPVARKPKAK